MKGKMGYDRRMWLALCFLFCLGDFCHVLSAQFFTHIELHPSLLPFMKKKRNVFTTGMFTLNAVGQQYGVLLGSLAVLSGIALLQQHVDSTQSTNRLSNHSNPSSQLNVKGGFDQLRVKGRKRRPNIHSLQQATRTSYNVLKSNNLYGTTSSQTTNSVYSSLVEKKAMYEKVLLQGGAYFCSSMLFYALDQEPRLSGKLLLLSITSTAKMLLSNIFIDAIAYHFNLSLQRQANTQLLTIPVLVIIFYLLCWGIDIMLGWYDTIFPRKVAILTAQDILAKEYGSFLLKVISWLSFLIGFVPFFFHLLKPSYITSLQLKKIVLWIKTGSEFSPSSTTGKLLYYYFLYTLPKLMLFWFRYYLITCKAPDAYKKELLLVKVAR